MIHIERSPEPERLKKHGVGWRDSYLKKLQSHKSGSKPRPHGGQYGHDEIRDALRLMGSDKCFYCEQPLDGKGEVEHFLEVAQEPELAFEWTNLYLSCRGCNSAKRTSDTLISDCLDPCDSEHDPAEHLTFSKDLIRPLSGSTLGRETIKKYDLNRGELTQKRTRSLLQFVEFLLRLREHSHTFTERQKEEIRSFAQCEHEFSLMFRIYLDGVNL